MKILALDIGDKRVGIAHSEPGFDIALPYATYKRKNNPSDFLYIAELVKEKDIALIVCGMPYNADGTESFQTKKTRRFIERLKTYTDIPIEEEDERFTTTAAEQLLISADMRREKRKQVIDKIAASYILESYLNKKRRQK